MSAKKRKKKKSKPYEDQLFTTVRGTWMFRSDLVKKISRANQVIKQAKAETKNKSEWGEYRNKMIPPTLHKLGKLSIKGTTNIGKLVMIEAAADKILKSGGAKKVLELREARYEKMVKTFEEEWKFTREEVDLLKDNLFESPEWELLRESNMVPSEDRARIIDDYISGVRARTLDSETVKEQIKEIIERKKKIDAGEISPRVTPPGGWKTAIEEWDDEEWDEWGGSDGSIYIHDDSVSVAQQILDVLSGRSRYEKKKG